MAKSGKADSKFWVLIGILVVAILVSQNVIDLKAMFGVEKAPINGEGDEITFCTVEDTTYTMTFDDFYNAGTQPTAAADDAVAVFVDGVKKDGSYASGDSLTLSPNTAVEVYLYDDAEDNAMVSANTVKHAFTVPCKGTKDDTIKVYDIGASAAATDGTWIILDDTYTSIKQATGYDMGQGQSKSATFKYNYVTDDAFGSPDGKNCIVFQGNKSLIKAIKLDGKTDEGCSPSALTIDPVKTTDVEIWSFVIDPFISNGQYNAAIVIELESGDQGEPVAADASHDVNITVFDSQWYYNADNGKMEIGLEDEDNNLLGIAELNTWFGIQ